MVPNHTDVLSQTAVAKLPVAMQTSSNNVLFCSVLFLNNMMFCSVLEQPLRLELPNAVVQLGQNELAYVGALSPPPPSPFCEPHRTPPKRCQSPSNVSPMLQIS